MSNTNEFLQFATDSEATVLTNEEWLAYTRTLGFQTGILYPSYLNKALRQGTFMSAVLAQVISDYLASDVTDDGVLSTKIALLKKLFCSPHVAYSASHTILAAERGCCLVTDASSGSVTYTLDATLGSASASFPFELEITRSVSDTTSNSIVLQDSSSNVIGILGPNAGNTTPSMHVRSNGTTISCSVIPA